jgi:ParB family chromosome partitioning protein
VRFDLDALASPAGPQELPIDAIDEDPMQPRQEFDPGALQELAETIAARGVLQPVSVRHQPERDGRYILNFGARRLRASRLAKKISIPAFVDDLATSYDQVIENEQREGLTPLELALFVERRMKAGDSQAEIARRLGKSRPYVTYATALIGAPDWLMTLYRDGRCRSLRALHELRQAQQRCPEAVSGLASEGEPITRERIAAMNAAIGNRDEKEELNAAPEEGPLRNSPPLRSALRIKGVDAVPDDAVGANRVNAMQSDSIRQSRGAALDRLTTSYALLAELAGKLVEVIVDAAPCEDRHVFVKTNGASLRQVVPATHLKLIRIAPRDVR